jgi:heme exporter protein CcmD
MMPELGRHGGYILASYAVTVLIIGALIALTVISYRRAQTRLRATGDDGV